MSYGIGINESACKEALDRVIRLQWGIIEGILQLPKTYPSDELCSPLNVSSFEYLYWLDTLKLLMVFFPKASFVGQLYRLSGGRWRVVAVPYFRLELGRGSVEYRCLDLFNQLPDFFKLVLMVGGEDRSCLLPRVKNFFQVIL